MLTDWNLILGNIRFQIIVYTSFLNLNRQALNECLQDLTLILKGVIMVSDKTLISHEAGYCLSGG